MKNLTKVQDGDTVDYKTLKAGDVTPDGMTFVAIYEDEETGKQKALLRTEFNWMSHYDAKAKADIKEHLGLRLPDIDETKIVSRAMTKEERHKFDEISKLWEVVAWTSKSYDEYRAYGVVLNNSYGQKFQSTVWDRSRPGQVCLVRSVDL